MIGQKKNLDYINHLQELPNFIIIIGGIGSGKKTLAKYIANKFSATYTQVGIKVDEVREAIDTAYKTRDKVLYCISDADTMRNEAKNALLKITEEPPQNAYFIMTFIDDSSVLETLTSRATVLNIEPYTNTDLDMYCSENNLSPKYNEIATTPYECVMMNSYGDEFIDYVSLVVDNIAEVQSANAFKSADKLAIRTDEGYDLKLFWEVFMDVCMKRLSQDYLKYAQGICTTVMYPIKVGKLGVNKQQLYDDWVFKIREVWL